MIFEGYRAPMYSHVRSMASSRHRTVKPWNSIQIEEEDVQFLETLVLNLFNRVKNCSWQLCNKAWQAFQFHLYSKDANFVHVTRSIFFQSRQLIKKKIVFLSPKVLAKKQPKYKYFSMESHQPYWVSSALYTYFSEQTREFYIFTWQTSVFVFSVPWKKQKYS